MLPAVEVAVKAPPVVTLAFIWMLLVAVSAIAPIPLFVIEAFTVMLLLAVRVRLVAVLYATGLTTQMLPAPVPGAFAVVTVTLLVPKAVVSWATVSRES